MGLPLGFGDGSHEKKQRQHLNQTPGGGCGEGGEREEGGGKEGEEFRADVQLPVDRVHNLHAAFHGLEGVDVKSMFETRVQVMETIPGCMRGVVGGALRLAIEAVLAGWTVGNVNRQERGWKLSFSVSRMLLYRPHRGGTLPRRKLQDRLGLFNRGSWVELVNGGPEAARVAKNIQVRKNRENRCGSDNIAARAEKLAMAEVECCTQGIGKVAPCTFGNSQGSHQPRTPASSPSISSPTWLDESNAEPYFSFRRLEVCTKCPQR